MAGLFWMPAVKVSLSEKGFSLLELAITLAVLGYLLYILIYGVKVFEDVDISQKNQVYLNKVQQALYTFVQVNQYLPCPDNNQDGLEDRVPGAGNNQCVVSSGGLPYLDLGVDAVDEWGTQLFYAINVDTTNAANILNSASPASYFSRVNAPVFSLMTPPESINAGSGNLTVCADSAGACNGGTAGANIIGLASIAVVVSFGKNGLETWDYIRGGNINLLSATEQENVDGDQFFWRARGSSANDQTEFDDQLIWISGYDVKYQLIKTGQPL